jgi:actin-like ATPase involved in cell morphogenesis
MIEVQDKAEIVGGPMGLDVGTCNIVMAQNKGGKISIAKQQNAFFAIPQSKFTRQILQKNEIVFFEHNKMFYIIGDSAENFANMFNANTMRPMEKGLLTFREDEGVAIIQAIIKTLVQRPKKLGEIICFSVPGDPVQEGEKVSTLSGHETVIKMYLESLGYTALSINEALAVVMAEMGDENFTGIGISMGGGMCNICLSYMSVPVITFSIQKGGDAIDESVSREVGMPATKVKGIKEAGINLSAIPKNKVELALQMYYTDLINTLVKSMEKVIASQIRFQRYLIHCLS